MNKLVAILAFLISSLNLFAGFTIVSDGDAKITSYPQFSLKIQLLSDSIPIILNKEQIYIIEDNNVTKPIDISIPDAFGFQTIRWYLSSNDISSPIVAVIIDSLVIYRKFNVYLNNPEEDKRASFIKFVDNRRNIIKELKFGNVPVGNYTNKGGDVIVSKNRIKNGNPLPVRIDSIGTSSNNFKYLWLGSNFNGNQPPVDIISPFPYSFEVIFFPSQSKYYREYFTINYDGGRKHSIALVGNSFPLPRQTQLQLLYPNGEEILYPCQKYLIHWNGHNPSNPVFIEYTTNQGKIWNPIAQVTGDSYLWTIPNIETDSLLIRIYQEYSPPAERRIGIGNRIPNKTCFGIDSNLIATATEDGTIEIYEPTENKLIFSFPFTFPAYPTFRAKVSSFDFFDENRKILMSYKYIDAFEQEGVDTIAILDVQNGKLIAKFEFPQTEGKLQNLILDRKKAQFYILPFLSNKLLCYSLSDGNFLYEIKFDFPIVNGIISRSGKYIVFATLNKDITIVNTKDFSLFTKIKCDYLPLVSKLAVSSDDRLIGFTTKPPSGSDEYSNLTDAFICDIATGQIIRSLYNNWSDAIGLEFSPAGNYLILAFENNPILIFWDIVNDVISSSVIGAGYKISDFRLSPSSFIIATSEPSLKKVILRYFNYPEMDLSNSPSKIRLPKITAKEFHFPPQPIYYSKNYLVNFNFCNDGEVPLIINNSFVLKNRNFHLLKGFAGDTLFPGECLEIPINYNPIDTGIVTDSVIIESCGNYFFLPLVGTGLNRNLKFLVDKIEIGNTCINETKDVELEVAINSDSLDFPVDTVLVTNTSDFQILDGASPQILKTNQKIKIKIRFTPHTTGAIYSLLEIYYLNQKQYVFRIPIDGFGYGTDLVLSTNDLRFIPEIPSRQITVTNPSTTEIQIDSINFSIPNIFTVNSAFPIPIQSESVKVIEIQLVDNNNISETKMDIFASPCAVVKSINLGPYIGTSYIWTDTIEHEPKGTISIPIRFRNTENSPYNGIRPFDAKMSINEGIFLPSEIYSDYGNARIVSQEIIDNRRIITFSINGNYPSYGTLAKISGYIGLSESDTGRIEFSSESKFWGKSIKTITNPGLIKLMGLCGSRRLQRDSSKIVLLSVSPNPSKNLIDLRYSISKLQEITIRVFDVQGNLIYEETALPNNIGENLLEIDLSNIQSGVYSLFIMITNDFDLIHFVKIPD